MCHVDGFIYLSIYIISYNNNNNSVVIICECELCIQSILWTIINIDDDDNTEEWFHENTEKLIH